VNNNEIEFIGNITKIENGVVMSPENYERKKWIMIPEYRKNTKVFSIGFVLIFSSLAPK
jgi:hypothetical protein